MYIRHLALDTRRLRGGFTLVELLIAVFLLALGLTFVFSLFPVGVFLQRENTAETRAAILARSALGRISAAHVLDYLDTAQLAVLQSTSPDAVGALRTGPSVDGFGPEDVRDTNISQYCWLATYARVSLDPAETGTDTSPLDALRVHIAVIRTGPSLNIDKLFDPDPGFAGQVVFKAGEKGAYIVQAPSDRGGFAAGNYVCDMRSGCWYRIVDLRDTGGSADFDRVVLRQPAKYDSIGGDAFKNALFVPNVVAVFDAVVPCLGRD